MYDGIWFITIGILFMIFGTPLFLKKIKPNSLYGLRTQKIKDNPELWYKVNKVCGKYLIIGGIISVILNIILILFFDNISLNTKRIIGSISVLIPLIISVIQGLMISNKEI